MKGGSVLPNIVMQAPWLPLIFFRVEECQRRMTDGTAVQCNDTDGTRTELSSVWRTQQRGRNSAANERFHAGWYQDRLRSIYCIAMVVRQLVLRVTKSTCGWVEEPRGMQYLAQQTARWAINNQLPLCNLSPTCFGLYRPSKGRPFTKEESSSKFCQKMCVGRPTICKPIKVAKHFRDIGLNYWKSACQDILSFIANICVSIIIFILMGLYPFVVCSCVWCGGPVYSQSVPSSMGNVKPRGARCKWHERQSVFVTLGCSNTNWKKLCFVGKAIFCSLVYGFVIFVGVYLVLRNCMPS